MSDRKFSVAVVGATGAVGREMVNILEERKFPIGELRLFASSRSAGEELEFRGSRIPVRVFKPERLEGCDIALFSAGSGVSREFAPKVAELGTVVIDNSSAWRMDPDVPLVVPEVNPEALEGFEEKNIIGNPNCSTIQMVMVLKPLADAVGLKRVVVATYQAASGAGQKGMDELANQAINFLNFRSIEVNKFPHQLAFNLIPHIDIFLDSGFTKEENKMIEETRKIMEMPELEVHPTCVRVPLFNCHSEAIWVETEEPISVERARSLFREFPGVEVYDDPSENRYPMPLQANQTDAVWVGRIRQLPGEERSLNLWCVADNLRKGAALNAVQIAELLIEEYL